jgi:hypothetical protein
MKIPCVRLVNADQIEHDLETKMLDLQFDLESAKTPDDIEMIEDQLRLIRKCVAVIKKAQTYEGDGVVTVIRDEKVIRCASCQWMEKREGWRPICRHPEGLLQIDDMSFCSKGAREA